MSDTPDTLVADYATTPHYGLLKPTTDSDDDLWGTHWNQNADTLDSLIWTINSAGYISQSAGDARWLNVAGDTMTGPLTLAADPAGPLQPVTLQYLQANTPTIASGDTRWVNVSGDVMQGSLSISPPSGTAVITLNKPAGGAQANQLGGNTNNVTRWLLQPGNGDPETGSNVGSNFGIYRYTDAGAYLGNPFLINRADGNVTLENRLQVKGNVIWFSNTSNYIDYNGTAIGLWGTYVDVHALFHVYSGVTVDGGITVASTIQSNNGRIIAYGGSNPALTAYNSAGYAGGMWCESGGTLSWGWCNVDGTPTDTRMYLNRNGDLYMAPGKAMTAAYMHSTGDVRADATVWAGGSGFNAWGLQGTAVLGNSYWMCFNWDGTNVPTYANGAYACTLVSSVWVGNNFKNISAYTPNQNVDYNSAPTFYDVHCGSRTYTNDLMNMTGTFYVANNYAYYLQRNGANGYWSFVENSTSCLEIRPDGTLVMYRGQAFKPGGGQWADVSDRRIKTVVGEYSRGLAEVLQIRPIYYRFKGNDANPETRIEQPVHQDTATLRAGLVAQEVEDVLPEMVTLGPGFLDGDAIDDMRILDMTTLPLALVNAVKELHARVAHLERLAS